MPDARFRRDPGVWRATYLVPAALMEPRPEELSLSWESGAGAVLPLNPGRTWITLVASAAEVKIAA